MVELSVQRLECFAELGEILHPAGLRTDRSADSQFDSKGMTMKAPALVLFRHVRQTMRRFYGENLEYFHTLPIFGDGLVYLFLPMLRRLS